jgi:O-methyltransferase
LAFVQTQYCKLGIMFRRIGRWFRPIASSPAYGPNDDICTVRLVPEEPLIDAFRRAICHLGLVGQHPAYVEFGVFNGTSLSCMSKASALENVPFKLIGLDSFEGLPQDVGHEDAGVWLPGQFACSRQSSEKCLSRFGLRLDEVELIGGWYNELTHADLHKVLGDRLASIIMIDCDAYSSAKKALELITPFLAPKSIIFFDDWRLRNVDLIGGGEYRAFNEWRACNPNWRVERFKSYIRKSEAFSLTAR